jgi:hypothetical protein
MIHLLHKGFMENYQCWYAHGEVFVSKSERRMKETVVGSTSKRMSLRDSRSFTVYCCTLHTRFIKWE